MRRRLQRTLRRPAMSNATPNDSNRNNRVFAARRVATHRRRILRILFLDNQQSDVELCLNELRRLDFAVSADWVQIPAEFGKRLRTQSYDVIVCEYSMPHWTGMEALDLLHQERQEIPFILATRRQSAGGEDERNLLPFLMQKVKGLHSSPMRHGVLAHNHVVGLGTQSFPEFRRDLNPVCGDCKIQPSELIQAEFDVRLLVIEE